MIARARHNAAPSRRVSIAASFLAEDAAQVSRQGMFLKMLAFHAQRITGMGGAALRLRPMVVDLCSIQQLMSTVVFHAASTRQDGQAEGKPSAGDVKSPKGMSGVRA
jgi:hypothetical protein